MKLVEAVFGPPMAAPESIGMKRLRLAVIALAGTLAGGILGIGIARALLGPVAAGALLAVLLLVTVALGTLFVVRKLRRDDAWLDQLIAKGREQ